MLLCLSSPMHPRSTILRFVSTYKAFGRPERYCFFLVTVPVGRLQQMKPPSSLSFGDHWGNGETYRCSFELALVTLNNKLTERW